MIYAGGRMKASWLKKQNKKKTKNKQTNKNKKQTRFLKFLKYHALYMIGKEKIKQHMINYCSSGLGLFKAQLDRNVGLHKLISVARFRKATIYIWIQSSFESVIEVLNR